MRLRVADEIEEIGLDHDQFDDEVIGEWGLYDTQEGHERRASASGGILQGISVGQSGTQTPTDVEQVKTEPGAKQE